MALGSMRSVSQGNWQIRIGSQDASELSNGHSSLRLRLRRSRSPLRVTLRLQLTGLGIPSHLKHCLGLRRACCCAEVPHRSAQTSIYLPQAHGPIGRPGEQMGNFGVDGNLKCARQRLERSVHSFFEACSIRVR